jgi:transcriptional regulator GlxA family with amidase domain
MVKSIVAILLTVTIINSCQKPAEQHEEETGFVPNLVDGRYNVAFLIMDGTFNTEFTAPFDIFQHTIFREGIKSMNVFTVAATLEPVTTFEGVRILPDFSYRDKKLPKIDILVVPSAEHHLDTDLENIELIDFVKKTADNALYITSHCDGAFVLAKSGILDKIESTTFPGDIDKYKATFPQLTVHKDVFFVHDGRFITSAGGARSFEAALYLTEVLYGREIAQSIAGGLVIDEVVLCGFSFLISCETKDAY